MIKFDMRGWFFFYPLFPLPIFKGHCCYAHGQVRALFDDGGNRVKEAGPSIPVQVST
jgi:hypothetical protein